MIDIPLKCDCGKVTGLAVNITPNLGNRLVCCCDTCQQFANFLRNDGTILDRHGGTDIYQMPLSFVRVVEGREHLRCVRLTPKGLHRWYTGCCRTPVGNTVSAAIPFIGVVRGFMDDESHPDAHLGPFRGYVQTRYALEPFTDDERVAPGFPLGVTSRVMIKILWWKLKGLNKPNAFFDNNGKPIVEPDVLSTQAAAP